jgi:hypothetical protein
VSREVAEGLSLHSGHSRLKKHQLLGWTPNTWLRTSRSSSLWIRVLLPIGRPSRCLVQEIKCRRNFKGRIHSYTSHLSQALQQDWIVYHRTAVLSISFPSFPFLRRQPFPCTSVLHSNSPLIGDTYALTDLGSYKQNTILGFWKNSFPRYICSSLNTSAPKLQITVCAGRPIRLMISQITSSTVSTPRNT